LQQIWRERRLWFHRGSPGRYSNHYLTNTKPVGCSRSERLLYVLSHLRVSVDAKWSKREAAYPLLSVVKKMHRAVLKGTGKGKAVPVLN
jgi:hypothetical protein